MKPFSKTSRFLKKIRKTDIDKRPRDKTVFFTAVFKTFQDTLALNNQVLTLIAEMGDKLSGDFVFDIHYIQTVCAKAADLVHRLIANLNTLSFHKYMNLYDAFQKINAELKAELSGRPVIPESQDVLAYAEISRDAEEVAGAKNANLGEIKNVLGSEVPDGFVITAQAFASFMTHNGLWEKVAAIEDTWRHRQLSVTTASAQVQKAILEGEIPASLRKEIEKALAWLGHDPGKRTLYLAVRSSAWGEDNEPSFAGQYVTLLNQPSDKIFDAYKTVLAGAYSASAMEYRKQKGYSEGKVVMAVGCQLMVDAMAGGVLYTFDPQAPERDVMLISCVWGLGAPVVEGRAVADQYQVSRRFPYNPEKTDIACKTETLVPRSGGGTEMVSIAPNLQATACLPPNQLKRLAEAGLMIEKHFKTPQDIEFAVDSAGKIIILQARSLMVQFNRSRIVGDLPAILRDHPAIFIGKGSIVQRGIGIGRVFIVYRDEDLDVFPRGAILVSKYTSPRFAKVIRKTAGIITDVGSATGHMATIAREFRVPTIVNTGVATTLLRSGQEITLDAEENKIYDGIIKELRNYHLAEDPIEETYEYRLLRRVLKKISRLNLVDPASRDFAPSSCRTFHDIIRFVHEKTVEELINLNYDRHANINANGGKLKLSVPLNLLLIDVGEGLAETTGRKTILPEQIASIPMRAFIDGLTAPGAWNTEPTSLDFGSFMSSMTRTFFPGLATPRYIGQNLALISKSYAHISLRLGYHFNMIDAFVSDDDNSNYIYFRFMGGVTDMTKRSRRAQFLADVLAKNDFRVEVHGDLVVARIKKLSMERIKRRLNLVGVLVAFSRQLDVQMVNDQQISLYADQFNELITSTLNLNMQELSHHG